MGLANIDSGLDDDQIQSLVHQLRHEYTDGQHHTGGPDGQQPAPGSESPTAWDRFRTATATRISAHPDLRPQRRAGLLHRITQADQTPPADMVYTAERIRDRAIRAARLMDDHLATEAARIGVADHDALSSYEQARRDAPTGRQARATNEQRRSWPGLPLDPRTRHGLATLAARPDNPDGRRELIDQHRDVQATGTTVVAGTGYHPGSGRLEVLTPAGVVLAYRQVPPAVAEQLSTGADPDQLYRDRLQGNPAFQYRDAVQAAAAGVRRRCSDCGQFTGATHNCLGRRGGIRAGALGPVTPLFPTPLTNQVLPSIGAQNVDLPVRIAPLGQVNGGLERLRGEGVEFPFQATYPTGEHLTGSLSGALDTDDHVSINSAHLTCTCDGYTPGQGCPHIQAAAAGVRDALAQQLIDHRTRAAAATAAAIASSTTTRPASEPALPGAPDLSTFSYTQDGGRFADDVRAALARPAGQQVPWIGATDTDPGLYGYGATREFGVELEFDVHHHAPRYGDLELDQRIDYRYRSTSPRRLAVGRVARALYEDNFTNHDRQSGYHTGVRNGYQRNLRGGWVYESDGSVDGGEVVSPILSDTPETWQRLHQVCDIITRHGGTASSHTGSHITVSAPEQAGRALRLTRFLRLMHHHQRDLHVMAAAGQNRGQVYSAAMPAPPDQGYTRIGDARQLLGRYSFANIAHIATSRNEAAANSSRVEFRLWDGSLEPGRIQAQVKMSTAMLDYTARNRDLTFAADERTPAGTLNPDRPEFAEGTRQIRGLIDQLFRRDLDKQQAAALWAAGLGARNFTREQLR